MPRAKENLKDTMVVCPKCGKLRHKFIKKVDYCQVCYREILDEYSLYDYKTPKEKLRGNSLKICELLIEKGVERQEIHKLLGLNPIYVQQIVKKHTNRVNTDNKKRPF